jgi:hypothetical protein
MRRPLLALLLLGAGLSGAAGAVAQAPGLTISLQPNVTGRPSNLIIEADGQAAQNDSRVPRSAVLSIQRGFKLDPRARSARCTTRQAADFECPKASRIGGGAAVVTASGAIVPGGSQDFTAAIDLFLAPPERPHDLAGVVVYVHEPTTGTRGTSTGRLVARGRGPYGYELRFERLSAGQSPPPGVTIKLKHLELRVGARRTVTRAGRRIVHSLITNPATCDGTWNGHGVVTFTDGSTSETGLQVACRRR